MSDTGFSIVEGVLSEQECALLANAISSAQRRRAGARNLMSNKTIESLACDSRLLRLAADTLGGSAVPFRATLFEKSKTSNWHVLWHQDRALPLTKREESVEWGPWSVKSGVLFALAPAWALERCVALRIHVDASREENGALRVIPGSHKAGVLCNQEITRTIKAVPSNVCVVGRGGVLALRPLLLHSSMKATDNQPRRVLHIEYANGLDLGNDIRLSVA